jgi:glucose-1-phosphatase
MPPKMLYFDLGNVLLSFSHEQMYRQMAEAMEISPDILQRAFLSQGPAADLIVQYETGQLTTDEFNEAVHRLIDRRPDLQRFAKAVSDIFAPMPETWKIVEHLAGAGHPMAILSNTNPAHWEWVTDGRFPLVAEIGEPESPFAWAILSYEAGAMKPDRAIYQTAIARAGVPAGDIFFVDDRPENVEGARAVGIDAVQFEGAEKFRRDLAERDIVVP